MKLFGLSITKTAVSTADSGLQSIATVPSATWWPLSKVLESFSGAWQRNVEISVPDVLTCGPVWACVTLIAFDISKMEVGLQAKNGEIWEDVTNPAYSPVLRKPNDYQNRIEFFESWLVSKLVWGNTYVLKERDERGVVKQLYVLDPSRVRVMVAPDGAVFYELGQDYLTGLQANTLMVPASEIIHDKYIALYHPLCGVSPIHACGLAAMQGLKIRRNSSLFFDNRSNLDGILVAPGPISQATAKRLEDYWNSNYGGQNGIGKIAALGDGLKFEPMTMTARDAEQSTQLKDAGLEVCSAFHVPAYMVGIGDPPNYNNIEALNAQYYAQCLQVLIEKIELGLKEGLDLANDLRVQFDRDSLIKMDTAAQMDKVTKGIAGGVYTPNEARQQFNLKPIKGGDTVYLQEQDHALQALAARDAGPDPFGKAAATPKPAPAPEPTKELPDIAAKAWLLQEIEERLNRAA